MIVNVDVDGVLRDMITPAIQCYKEQYDQLINVSYRDMKTFDFSKGPLTKIDDIYVFLRVNSERLFLNSKPYKGAKYFMDELKHNGHRINIVTNQILGTEHLTVRWLNENKMPYHSLHVTSNKNEVNGDIFLDDMIENLVISDKYAICFNQPWNQSYTGTRANSYDEVLKLVEAYSKR